MFKNIDEYLNKIKQNLRPMPAALRDEELREMRIHLEDAIMARRKQGMSEQESLRSAVRQFGSPRMAAVKLVAAWGRGILKPWLHPACIFALIFGLFYSVPYVTGPLIAHLFGGVWQSHSAEVMPRHPLPPLGRAVLMASAFGAYPAAAFVLGFVYPKAGVRAMAIATGLWLLFTLAINLHLPTEANGVFLAVAVCILAQAPAAVVGAWCRNRWQAHHNPSIAG